MVQKAFCNAGVVSKDQWVPVISLISDRRKALYLTHSINTDVPVVVGAGGAVFDLAGHGEEEVKVFRNAVKLTDVFI